MVIYHLIPKVNDTQSSSFSLSCYLHCGLPTMILDHKTGLHSHGRASARSQNLILQFHSEKIVHPVLRSQSELRLIYFFVLSKWF